MSLGYTCCLPAGGRVAAPKVAAVRQFSLPHAANVSKYTNAYVNTPPFFCKYIHWSHIFAAVYFVWTWQTKTRKPLILNFFLLLLNINFPPPVTGEQKWKERDVYPFKVSLFIGNKVMKKVSNCCCLLSKHLFFFLTRLLDTFTANPPKEIRPEPNNRHTQERLHRKADCIFLLMFSVCFCLL